MKSIKKTLAVFTLLVFLQGCTPTIAALDIYERSQGRDLGQGGLLLYAIAIATDIVYINNINKQIRQNGRNSGEANNAIYIPIVSLVLYFIIGSIADYFSD